MSEATAVVEALTVPQDGLERYKKMFAQARDATAEQRRQNAVCVDYFHDRQWTSDEIKVLKKRKQPQIWVNRIKPAVNGVLGVIEQGLSDPRAYPRNSDDENSAEIATDSLRYASDQARWPRTKLKGAKDYLLTGTAACIVEVDEELDPSPRRIRWQEFFWDPHSQEDDFSDARYMGVAKWMYVDEARGLAPEGMTVDLDSLGTGQTIAGIDADDEDKPSSWGDRKGKRVMVVEMYHQVRGVWHRCLFWGGGVFQEGPSPYLNERGEPSNPIEAQSATVDRENLRWGMVRTMIPLQDEKNMQRSKRLHLLNSRRVRQTDLSADQNIQLVRDEAARPDGVIPYGYEVADNLPAAMGHAALEADGTGELERMGPNPAVLGRDGSSASGRSHLVRQQAGLTELTPELGGLEDWELRVYRQMWARIRQFWTEPKMIRVTDDIGAPKFLQVNEPVVVGEQLVLGPDGMPVVEPIIEYQNRPAEIDVDIIIDSTPDTATLQAEQFTEMLKLAQMYGPQEVPFDDVLKLSAMPRKREVMDARKERQAQAQGQQGPNPMQQAAFQAELENKAADTEAKRARALKDVVSAETDRVNALMAPAQTFPSAAYPGV